MTTSLKPADLPYRACVGILLINTQAKIFVGHRVKENAYSGWQMPQGGIVKGEPPRKAALRELLEEVGTDKVEIIAANEGWFSYDLPADLLENVWRRRYRGQKQKWFAMKFLGNDDDINLEHHHNPEFDDFKWVDIEDLPDLIIPFKRGVYEQVVAEFRDLVRDLPVN